MAASGSPDFQMYLLPYASLPLLSVPAPWSDVVWILDLSSIFDEDN